MKILKSIILVLIIASYSFADIKEDIETLAKSPRYIGTASCLEARDYIVNRLKNYKIQIQEFTIGRRVAYNVIATKNGGKKVLVIGAHYDTVWKSPGADDNASGVAGILELADRLKDKNLNHTIIFILFSGEEQGLLGSEYYVKNINLKNYKFMLNLDMIGHLKNNSRWSYLDVNEILKSLYQKYDFAQSITLRSGGSDQESFVKYMPVVFLHTGLHRHYHQVTDKPDTLNYQGISKVIDYAYDLILSLDGPKKEIDYDQLTKGLPCIDHY